VDDLKKKYAKEKTVTLGELGILEEKFLKQVKSKLTHIFNC